MARLDGGEMFGKSAGLNCATLAAAWEDVRNDATPTTWALCPLAGKTEIGPAQQGSTKTALLEALAAASGVAVFGGVRTPAGRFHTFFLVGADVGGIKRGQASMVKNAGINCMVGSAGELICNDLEELVEKLEGVGFA